MGLQSVSGSGTTTIRRRSTRSAIAADARIDVVILTWNDEPEVLDRSIHSALGSVGVGVHVIVVDNGSETPAVVPSGVTLVRSARNLGVAAGRNLGIRHGNAPLVLLLDSDAELLPTSLATLAAERHRTGAGVLVPTFVGQSPSESAGSAPGLGRKVQRVLGRTAEYAEIESPLGASEPSWPVEFGIGACQLFPRQVWSDVGGIDESFFYGPEDVDFCLRVGALGWPVRQAADGQVIHPPRRRHRKPLNRAGLRHSWAVLRYLARHHRRLSRTRSAA